METVVAILIAAVGRLSQPNDIRAVRGHDQANERILQAELRVIHIRQHHALAVQHGQTRIEDTAAQAHAFNLRRQPVPLPGLYRETVYVLARDDTRDGRIKRHLLRLVGSLLGSVSAMTGYGPTKNVRNSETPVSVRTRKWCSPNGQSGAIRTCALTMLFVAGLSFRTSNPGS